MNQCKSTDSLNIMIFPLRQILPSTCLSCYLNMETNGLASWNVHVIQGVTVLCINCMRGFIVEIYLVWSLSASNNFLFNMVKFGCDSHGYLLSWRICLQNVLKSFKQNLMSGYFCGLVTIPQVVLGPSLS